MLKKIFCFLMLLSLCSCGLYRAPTEDDFARSPTTNNPKVVGNKGRNELSPAVTY